MLVLGENLPAGQRQLLRKWRVHFRIVGVDVASRGSDDENSLAEPTKRKRAVGAELNWRCHA